MADAGDKTVNAHVAAIRAGFGDRQVSRFLQNLPIFQVDSMPETLEEKLRRLEQAEYRAERSNDRDIF